MVLTVQIYCFVHSASLGLIVKHTIRTAALGVTVICHTMESGFSFSYCSAELPQRPIGKAFAPRVEDLGLVPDFPMGFFSG